MRGAKFKGDALSKLFTHRVAGALNAMPEVVVVKADTILAFK